MIPGKSDNIRLPWKDESKCYWMLIPQYGIITIAGKDESKMHWMIVRRCDIITIPEPIKYRSRGMPFGWPSGTPLFLLFHINIMWSLSRGRRWENEKQRCSRVRHWARRADVGTGRPAWDLSRDSVSQTPPGAGASGKRADDPDHPGHCRAEVVIRAATPRPEDGGLWRFFL